MEIVKFKNGSTPTFSGLLDEFFNKEFNLNEGVTFRRNMPAVNIQESEDKFVMQIAAPGLKRENFAIEVTDDKFINISSEVQDEKTSENEAKNFQLKEFSYSAFSRSFRIPESADVENIKANYENGLLELVLPKKAEALPKPPRLIEVK